MSRSDNGLLHPAAAAAVLVLSLTSGCGLKYSGLAALEPKPKQIGFWSAPTTHDLTPTLRWESFPRKRDVEKIAQGKPQRISDVRYDLRLWNRRHSPSSRSGVAQPGSWVPPEPIVRNLQSPSYVVPAPLQPDSDYLWTVRVWYRLDGRLRVSQWSRCGRMDDEFPLTLEVPEQFAFDFRTPHVERH